jgi:hypothetical protein
VKERCRVMTDATLIAAPRSWHPLISIGNVHRRSPRLKLRRVFRTLAENLAEISFLAVAAASRLRASQFAWCISQTMRGLFMRRPKPFFRKFTSTWYVQIGKQQVNLGPDEKAAWSKYHQLMLGQVDNGDSVAVSAIAVTRQPVA